MAIKKQISKKETKLINEAFGVTAEPDDDTLYQYKAELSFGIATYTPVTAKLHLDREIEKFIYTLKHDPNFSVSPRTFNFTEKK